MRVYCSVCNNALEKTWLGSWRCWHCGALYTDEEVQELREAANENTFW
jgi:hypothetical protein